LGESEFFIDGDSTFPDSGGKVEKIKSQERTVYFSICCQVLSRVNLIFYALTVAMAD